MADESYIDLYDENDKEGMIVKGKDVVMLDAREVLLSPDTPLLTKAQDVAGAINELFSSGTGGGEFNGTLRAVIDDDTGAIVIVVGVLQENTDTDEDEQKELYSDFDYVYNAVEYSDTITTESTSGDTTTTTTQIFDKRIITELYNAEGKLLMYADYDKKTGKVKGYYDADDMPIYLAEWRE